MLFPANLLAITERTKIDKKAGIRWQNSTPPRASNGGRSLCVQISTETELPLPIYWYHPKGNWLRYNFAANSFYIMKLRRRLLVLYCWNCPKDDKFRYLIPILRKLAVSGSLESLYRLLINCNWTSFSISYRWHATRQNVSKLTAS